MSVLARFLCDKRFARYAVCATLIGVLPASAGAQANTSLIKLSYRCGNWFRVRNANSVDVSVQYTVYKVGENGNLTLPAAPPSVGYSDTWFQTHNRGSVLITYGGARVAEKPNANAACAGPWSVGQWSGVIQWPIVAIHSHLLPNGKVLTWGREHADSDGYTIPFGKYNGIPNIWDPSSGTFTWVDAGADLFCSGHAFLPDGRLMEAGGSDDHDGRGQRFAWIFDYNSSSWTRTANMADGRWYPTVTTLTNGQSFIVSGTDTSMNIDSVPEIYNPSTNTFTELTGLTAQLGYWAWTFVAPNGQLFYAGDGGYTYYINTSGVGSIGQGFSTNPELYRDYGSAVMYDTGKVLIVGGGSTTTSQQTAEVIDLNQSSPQWQQVASMNFPRRQLNAVLLANGEIMVSGGSAGPDFNPATNIVYTPEIWSPTTQQWTEMARYQMPRLYHSETLLLTDGRVLSVGGGQPAATGLPDNFNAEIFSPPYLFNPDGSAVTASRPIIAAAPASVGYGSNFTLTVQNLPAGTGSVLWIRLGSVTHAINMNQRLNHLAASQSGNTLTVTAPANANLAPPGHYLLFVLNANGVPSVGTVIQIQ